MKQRKEGHGAGGEDHFMGVGERPAASSDRVLELRGEGPKGSTAEGLKDFANQKSEDFISPGRSSLLGKPIKSQPRNPDYKIVLCKIHTLMEVNNYP